MSDTNHTYISRSIQSVYKKRLIAPAIYIIFLVSMWLLFGIHAMIFPGSVSSESNIQTLYKQNIKYVTMHFDKLYFTGYTQTFLGNKLGYYYYTKYNGHILIVLLTPKQSQEGLFELKNISSTARILPVRDSATFRIFVNNMAKDLNWTSVGFRGQVYPYFLSQPDVHFVLTYLFLFVYFFSGIYAIMSIFKFIFYIRFPHLATVCRQLKAYGKPKDILMQAEEELATLPQLATEDMFITEHYFIEISKYGIAIVPISEIIWIYKHSTLNKFFWYHFNISYTLHITAHNHLYIQCPKSLKSDIDGIIDYLAEANHSIFVGFSEENRKKVQKIQGTILQTERLLAFLKKRI